MPTAKAPRSKARKVETATARMLAPRAGDVTFRELSKDEIQEMLLRNNVGRLAFAVADRVDIQPIHYVYERGWLYGRTSEGDKISALETNQWIALEIDEVAGLFDWRSVVLHGRLVILHPRGSPRAEEDWKHASELVARIVPTALSEEDPVAFRQTLFRIGVADLRGRQALTKPFEGNNP